MRTNSESEPARIKSADLYDEQDASHDERKLTGREAAEEGK